MQWVSETDTVADTMNLRDYLTQHDGRLSKSGRELHRLARAAGCSASHTYLMALGHKYPSRALASRLAEASKGRMLDASTLLGLATPRSRRPRAD